MWLVDAKLIPADSHEKHVRAMLELSPFGPAVSKEHLLDWARLYRGHRDNEMPAKEAAKAAMEEFGEGN
jgi:hypothetical protein